MEIIKGLPLYYADIDDSVDGVSVVSLVNRPAIEAAFVRFAEQPIRLSADEERHIVSGVALIPDYPIYRNDAQRGEFYIAFTRDAIARIVERFFENRNSTSVNLEHNDAVHTCVIFESYLIDHNRGVAPVEFADYPDGTWAISTKINDEVLWQEVKAGKYTGFSVEGVCTLVPATAKPEPSEPTFEGLCAEARQILQNL